MLKRKKAGGKCMVCDNQTFRRGYKYCSASCQMVYQYEAYIKRWQAGEESGLQGLGIVSGHVKRYLRNKFEHKCCLCGWAEINSRLGYSPLVADHIDGNWRNNVESNLRLICPNCDSLTPTYAGLNRGNGRKNRVVSKRAHEGRLFIRNMAK